MQTAIALALVAMAAQGQADHSGHAVPSEDARAPRADPRPLPEGYAEVALPSDRIQLLGVKLAPVRRGSLAGTIRAPAVIATNEKTEAHIHSKVMGWVEELFVNSVGQVVKEGDPLYSLYSQELFAAQQEFVRARRFSSDLAAAARTRLQLWDVPPDQLRLIERKGPRRAVIFRSPIDGTVIEKRVLQGHSIDETQTLYRIADLSTVWAVVDVYEYEVSRLAEEGVGTVTVQGLPGRYRAKIDYVSPTVDPATRTIKVRLVLDNPDGALRPGSFATAELPSKRSDSLWVPAEAVIDTGVRQVIYVAVAEGRFRPVEVRIGRRAHGQAEVLEGLAEGEQVLASAQFLIDSESRLRGTGGSGQPGHGGH